MPKGYWIAHVDIADAARYLDYIRANDEAFKEFGGRFLVRAGEHVVAEGTSRTRHVVIEFPSYQAAINCYASPAYQRALMLRRDASTVDLIIIEGYEGLQPT